MIWLKFVDSDINSKRDVSPGVVADILLISPYIAKWLILMNLLFVWFSSTVLSLKLRQPGQLVQK